MTMRPSAITDDHLRRIALLYLRQSDPRQVRDNWGSTEAQRELVNLLKAWGWPAERIQIIDDLGMHASVAGDRVGLKDALEMMRQDRVGIFMVSDDDRLSRNRLDFAEFQEVSAVHNVLYAIRDQVFDYSSPENELVGQIISDTTVYRSKALFRMLKNAKVAMAKKGRAVSWPPVGYVAIDRRWIKDPDPAVREVIDLIFTKIFELGSGRALVRYLRRRGIKIPRRPRQGEPKRWADATWSHLQLFFRNEAYTGVYSYGVRAVDRRAPRYRNGHHRRRNVRAEDVIRHENHHEPYIEPDRWRAIHALLRGNINVPGRSTVLGRGPTLVQGLLRCTVHDATLYPTFSRHQERLPGGQAVSAASYDCVRRFAERAESARCMRLRARWLHPLIEKELFRELTPPRFEAVAAAVAEAQVAYDAARRHRDQHASRLEQLAAQLQREYINAPDSSPFLKERLRCDAEDACAKHAALLEEYRRQPLQAPVELTEAQKQEIRAKLADLPGLWHHPGISHEQRKLLCRRAIRKIHLTPGAETIRVEIEWAWGATTRVQFLTHDGTDAIIARGIEAGLSAPAIAEQLNAAGARRWKTLGPFTSADVHSRARMLGIAPPSAAACEIIVAGLRTHKSVLAVAAELERRGIKHRLGPWRYVFVLGALKQMKAGKVAGFESPPPLTNARTELQRLWNESHDAEHVAAQLNALGFRRTKGTRLYTARAVRRRLRNAGTDAPAQHHEVGPHARSARD